MLKLLQRCRHFLLGASAFLVALLSAIALLGPTSTAALAYATPYDPGATGNTCQGQSWQLISDSVNTGSLISAVTGQHFGSFTVEAKVFGAYDNTGSYCGFLDVVGTVTPTNGTISLDDNGVLTITANTYITNSQGRTPGHEYSQNQDVTSILGTGTSIYVGGPNDHTNDVISNGIQVTTPQCLAYTTYIAGDYAEKSINATGTDKPPHHAHAVICPPQTLES